MSDQPTLKNGTAQRKVEELNQTVEKKLERLEMAMMSGHSQVFLDALKFWSRQYRYSFNNSLLIYSQNPNATFVAGYKKLQELGWQVRRGAMAIYVRGPWLRKEVDQETGEIVQKLIGYIPLCVFDVSQTVEWEEGKRPPEPMIPATGADWEDLYIKWTRSLTTLYGIEVVEMEIGDAYGMCSPKRIRINSRKEIPTRATTLIHEWLHILANHHADKTKDLRQREMEVEAGTYVLCAILGAEHPAASDYLLNYEVQPDELKQNLEVIGRLVKQGKETLAVGFEPIQLESEEKALEAAA